MDKATIQRVLDKQQEPVDVDRFIDELYFFRRIEEAEKEIAAGQGIPHDEARRRLECLARTGLT